MPQRHTASHCQQQTSIRGNPDPQFTEMVSRRWEEMQMDCLANIFSRLGADDLTATVPFVCKSWLEASADPLCWAVLDFRRLDFDPASHLAAVFGARSSVPRFSFSGFLKLALARAGGALVDLRFSPLVNPSKEDLSLASDICPKLKNLSLPRIGAEDEEEFLQAIEKWKELEVLEMDSKPSNLPELARRIGLSCRSFRGLRLRGAIDKEDAAAIAECLPKLRCLDLSSCRLGRGELLVIVEGCRELSRLSVRDCVGFEPDEEVKGRGRGIDVFEHDGSAVKGDCEFDDGDVDEDNAQNGGGSDLEQMFRYYDDCYAMWLF